jgi:hypothetical protein
LLSPSHSDYMTTVRSPFERSSTSKGQTSESRRRLQLLLQLGEATGHPLWTVSGRKGDPVEFNAVSEETCTFDCVTDTSFTVLYFSIQYAAT